MARETVLTPPRLRVGMSLLFVAALGIRLAANAAPAPLTGDAVSHEAKALSLLEGNGYAMQGVLTSFKPPGYPAFLTICYRLFSHDHRTVVWVQSLLGALTCLIVVAIGGRLGFPLVGLVGGAFAAVSASLVRGCGLLVSETLATFLLALSVWSALACWQDRKLWQAAAWGVSLGLLALTRSVMVALPLCWWAVAWFSSWRSQPDRRVLSQRLGIGLLLAIGLIGAWTWRNWTVHRALVLVSTDGGRAFYSSYRPPDGYRFGFNANDALAQRAERITSEVERDRFYYAATWAWLRAHLGELPRLLLLKFAYLGSPWDWELIGRDGEARYNWLYGITGPFVLIGAWLLRRRAEARWALVPIGYVLVMTAVFYGSPRFRLPIEPYLLLLAAVGLGWVFQHVASWRMRAGVVAADLASNALLIVAMRVLRG